MYSYDKAALIAAYRNGKSVREAASVCSIPYSVARRALANAGELDELLSDDIQREIVRSYAQTQNVKQTARLFHVPAYTVSNVLRRHGISVENNKNTQTFGNSLSDSCVSEIISLYSAGKTASEIAKETGFALQTIQKYLLRAGFADAKKSRKVLSAEDEYTLLKQIADYYAANGNVEKTKKHFKVGRPTVHRACEQFGVQLRKRQRGMTEERKQRYLRIAETYSQVQNTEKTAAICDCNIETVYAACKYYHVEIHKRKKLQQGDAVRVLSVEACISTDWKSVVDLAQTQEQIARFAYGTVCDLTQSYTLLSTNAEHCLVGQYDKSGNLTGAVYLIQNFGIALIQK